MRTILIDKLRLKAGGAVLKRCPFCGCEARMLFFKDEDCCEFRVECTMCFAATFYEEAFDDAVETWNRRADG